MKKNILTLLAASLLAGCASEPGEEEKPGIEAYPIQHEQEFGGVYIEISIDDFNALGFTYGDSVDVTFSNGYELKDIPYYNGYYVAAGEPLLIAYPGYDYIKAAVNYGADLWETANLQLMPGARQEPRESLWLTSGVQEHDTASVKLNEKGKYLDIQEARDIAYTDIRTDYPSDEVFANFRPINMGSLKENMVYRSASPCDNSHNRAEYVDQLCEKAEINTILNLSDNDVKIQSYMARHGFNCEYFRGLYEYGHVIPIALNMNYLADEFARKIAQGFTDISAFDGPYLIHCTEGKDRTGFVCMLVEMLAGASYEEIVADYMLTYDNYYQINEAEQPAKYKTIKEMNIDAMIGFVVNDPSVDYKNASLAPYAEAYLRKAGMSQEALDAFKARILRG